MYEYGGEVGGDSICSEITRISGSILNLYQLHSPRSPSFNTHRRLRTPHLRGYQPNQFKVSLAIHRQRFDLRYPSPILHLRQAALPGVGFDFDLQDGRQGGFDLQIITQIIHKISHTNDGNAFVWAHADQVFFVT